jgi:hypothetical protein
MFEPSTPAEDHDWDLDDALSGSIPTSEVLADCIAGGTGAGRVLLLAHIDPGTLAADECIDLLVALERQKAWLDSLQKATLAVIDQADTTSMNLSQEAVMCALRLSGRSAQARLKVARTLTESLPATFEMLRRGALSSRQAELIAQASWSVLPDALAEFEKLVLRRASEQTETELRKAIARAAIQVDPATAETRHQRARQERAVRLRPAWDGMSELSALLPSADAEAIYARLDGGARLLPTEDPRTMDQRRADLLVDAVLTGIPHDALPELQARRPTVQIVVSASTLLGLDDEPADLAGYGAITAETARQLAADPTGTWQRLLTDPNSGALLDCGAENYRPSAHLTGFLLARDGVCIFPGCNQPGHRCDVEHRIPHDQGGPTCPGNNALVCRRHHNCKTHGPWRYRFNDDGSFTWTAATGHTYTIRPPERWKQPGPEPTWREWCERTRDAAYAQRAEDLEHAFQSWEKRLLVTIERARESGETEREQDARHALEAGRADRRTEVAAFSTVGPAGELPEDPPF